MRPNFALRKDLRRRKAVPEIAVEASFFSFGTNDLTQMTFGFSRDDSDKFLKPYVEQKILPGDPFESIDQSGVG